MVKGKTHQAEIAEAMVATRLLDGLPAKAAQVLSDRGRLRNYRKGTYLCHQGDPADAAFFLLNGRVEIASVSVTGPHPARDRRGPAFVGELGILAEMRSHGERVDARGFGGLGGPR